MIDIIVMFFLTIGAIFIFISSIGLLKMPDVYLRMSSATVAGTIGVALMLIAAAIYFLNLTLTLHIIGIIILLILTVPIGAHMLGRSAHIIGITMWEKTIEDELKGKYNEDTNDFDGICDDNNDNNK